MELSFIIHIRVHTNKMTSEKLRRHNLIFIYEDRPVSREAQTDRDRCLVLRPLVPAHAVDGRRIDFLSRSEPLYKL